jgi:hypothetical protein
MVRRTQLGYVAASASLLALASWQPGHGSMHARSARDGKQQHGPVEWPPRSSTTRHGFAAGAGSNFSSNIPLEPGGTDYVENLSGLQAEAAADDFFLDLGGAAEDRLDAAEPPELTIVPENSGVVLSPVKAGLLLVGLSHGVRGVRSGRRSRARGSSRRVAAPRAAAWPRRRRRTSGRGYPSRHCGRRLR